MNSDHYISKYAQIIHLSAMRDREKNMEALVAEMYWGIAVICACSLIISVCELVWLKPRRIRSALRRQGISGPRPTFLHGNVSEMGRIQSTVMRTPSDGQQIIHNWSDSIFPYLQQWTKEYGQVYMYSTGNKQHLYISQPELMKELHLHKSLDFGRPTYLTTALQPLLGHGIIKANGQHWAYQRKLLAPEFFLDKVKDMVGMMEDSTITMIKRWESRIRESEGGVLDETVDEDLRSVSADIISRYCFGTSYSQGKFIFAKLGDLQKSLSRPGLIFGLSNFRFIPTKNNREVWRLKKEIDELILKVVKDRQNSESEKDLLQMLLLESDTASAAKNGTSKINRLMVDICKNIYFAGYETSALTTSWCLMLLALHPEWQERVRAEILEVLGPDYQCPSLRPGSISPLLPKLKLLTMVIQETLRLYGPSIIISKEAFAEIKFGDLVVPKGTNIWSLIPALHRDPENWGPDANEFKPERFSHGVSEACKYPHAYIPFGFGTRQCLGQTFAMVELKIVLSLILSKFSFSISPNYCHSPVFRMLLVPEHNVRLLIKSV